MKVSSCMAAHQTVAAGQSATCTLDSSLEYENKRATRLLSRRSFVPASFDEVYRSTRRLRWTPAATSTGKAKRIRVLNQLIQSWSEFHSKQRSLLLCVKPSAPRA